MRKKNKERLRILAVARENGGATGDGGLAVLGQSGTELLHFSSPETSEGIRRLVARLEASESGNIPDVIGVASALTGEGVTFVSRALGGVIANDLCRSVVVVETNWANPTGSEGLGLSDVLTGRVSLDEALVPTIVDHLQFLHAGATTFNERPVLVRSEALAKTIADLRTRFKHIIIDLPAVLATSDALTLATHADGVVLVVQQGVTAEPQVVRALSELEHLNVLGVVLNRWSTRVPNRVLAAIAPWNDATDNV